MVKCHHFNLNVMARPREFSEDEVLEQAMQAFWSHGYHSTSLADLMQAMGLQKGSIYKAFGDKHSLFLSALDRYIAMLDKLHKELIDSGKTPKEGLKLWLEAELKFICGQDLKQGCLAVNSLIERGYKDAEVAERLNNYFANVSKLLITTIEKGQAIHEFRVDLNAEELAQIIISTFTGMIALSKGISTAALSLKTANNMLRLIEQ